MSSEYFVSWWTTGSQRDGWDMKWNERDNEIILLFSSLHNQFDSCVCSISIFWWSLLLLLVLHFICYACRISWIILSMTLILSVSSFSLLTSSSFSFFISSSDETANLIKWSWVDSFTGEISLILSFSCLSSLVWLQDKEVTRGRQRNKRNHRHRTVWIEGGRQTMTMTALLKAFLVHWNEGLFSLHHPSSLILRFPCFFALLSVHLHWLQREMRRERTWDARSLIKSCPFHLSSLFTLFFCVSLWYKLLFYTKDKEVLEWVIEVET